MFPRSSFQTVGANPGPRTVSLDLPGLFKHPLRNSRPSTDLLALAEYCPDVRNCRDQIHGAAHRRIFFSGGEQKLVGALEASSYAPTGSFGNTLPFVLAMPPCDTW